MARLAQAEAHVSQSLKKRTTEAMMAKAASMAEAAEERNSKRKKDRKLHKGDAGVPGYTHSKLRINEIMKKQSYAIK